MELHERLIVAADFMPEPGSGVSSVKKKVLDFAESIMGTGVCLKLNSVLRACGYSLIKEIQSMDLRVFADLKLIDIPNTMSSDADLLREFSPDIVTVMCCAEVAGMMAVYSKLAIDTEVVGVTVLTSLDEERCQSVFGCSTKAGVLRFARLAQLAKLSGLVLSPHEVEIILKNTEISLELLTPGIRPQWSFVEGDDQSRVMTPRKAIAKGADRIIIGRPITQGWKNLMGGVKSPQEAIEWTLEEIEQGLGDRVK